MVTHDSIKLGEIIINEYYERGVPDFNGLESQKMTLLEKKNNLQAISNLMKPLEIL